VRAVNTSGVAGDWYKIGNANGAMSIGAGTAAAKSVGTTSGTVAAGDDSRITGSAQKSSNLSDLSNTSTARSNLGLGSIATQAASSVSITGGTVEGISSLKVGTGSATTAVSARYSGFVDVTLTGGAQSESFTISLTNRGFSGAPDVGLVSSIDSHYLVAYNRTTSSSTTANCVIRSTDGSNIPGTTTPIMFIFEE
jgi:hypothetical protein